MLPFFARSLSRRVMALGCAALSLALLLSALPAALRWGLAQLDTGALLCADTLRFHIRADSDSPADQTVKLAVPLLGCALAIAPCFKMRFWNIGAEGQITAGAIAASYFALYWVGKVPSAVLLLIMGAAGAVAGGIWALIPAFFMARWNTNETLFTLMMNYIIIGVVKWLQGGPWEAPPSGSQMIAQFAGNAKLPSVLGVHCGWIIVLVLTVLMFIYMRYTKHGYEIAVIGDSSNTARYAGMNVGRIMMRTMFLSGSISGLVGFIIVSGSNHTLYAGVAGGVFGLRAVQGYGERGFAFVIGIRRVLRPMLLRVAFDGRGRLCAAGGEQQKRGQKQDRNSLLHAKVLLRLFYRRRTKK